MREEGSTRCACCFSCLIVSSILPLLPSSSLAAGLLTTATTSAPSTCRREGTHGGESEARWWEREVTKYEEKGEEGGEKR